RASSQRPYKRDGLLSLPRDIVLHVGISTQRRKGAKAQKDGEGMTENEIAAIVVDAALEVHRTLGGPGLLEAVYAEALAFELESRGLAVVRQKAVPLMYKGKRLASDLRLDLLVGDRVIAP